MAHKIKTDRFPAVSAALLFLLAGFLKPTTPMLSELHILVFIFLNCFVFFGIIFCWGIYIERSILSDKIRRLLLTVVALMVLYIFIGAAKNRIFIDGNFMGRFLWYLYYLPQIFATFLTFIIAFRVGRPEEYRLPSVFRYLFVFGALIVIGYLTNDFHQLAFSFNPDFVAWDQQYDWGPLFYISTIWIYVWLLASVILLCIKCVAVNKKKAWIPIFWLAVGSAYIFCQYILNVLPIISFDLPEVHCFIVIAMLESCIRIGILPSNCSYGEIVSKSSADFQIATHDNRVVYRSEKAGKLSSAQMEEAKHGRVFIDKNTLLLSHWVSGGNVFWTEDITAVNDMHESLFQINQSLSEEGDLLRAENDIREQRIKIAEQTRLYDSISEFVKPQLESTLNLIEAEGDFKKNMAHICILNCYVKRRSNLILLGDRRRYISSDELYLSFKESAEYIRLYGVAADAFSEKGELLPSEVVLFSFDLWQNIIEELLGELRAVSVRMSFDKASFTLRVCVDTDKEPNISTRLSGCAEELDGILSLERENETVFVTFRVGKDGV